MSKDYASRRTSSELPGSLHRLMVNKPPLPEKTVEGHDFERFPELMAETESNPAPSSDPNDNVTCLYSANLTSRYFPPRQSSSSEESRLRSTFDEVEPDDDELTLPRKAGANGYYSSTRVSWPFDQASSASTSYNEGPPYPYPVHVQVTSDYASSPHILGAQFSERDLEQVYLASSSSGAAGSVPRALSNERHSHRDAGVSTDPEAPRGSWSRDNGYGTRSHFSDTHRLALPPVEHDRRLPYHPLQGAFRYPSFPPLPVGQQIRTTATEYLPPLPPFQEEQRYSREPDIFSNEQRRSFTYPQIQYEPPSREHDVPRDPPPAYPEGSEQELREDTPLYPEPVRPKRIAGPSRENKRKPIPKSAAPDEEEEEVDDQPKKVPRKTLIACGFCRKRKLKCDGQRPMCRNCSKRTEECAYAPFPRRRGPGKAPRGSKKTAKIRAVGQMPAPPGYTEFDSKQPTPGPSGLASDESQPLKPGQMKFTTRGSPIAVVEEVAEFREPARTRTETLPRYERVERTPGLYTEPAGQAVLGEKEMDVKYGGRILEGQASFTESPPQNLRSLAEEEV